MAKPVIKVARNGYDTSANPRLLTIDSSKNHSKVILAGTGTVTLNVGNDYDASVTITHNLGYEPAFIAWCEEEGVTKWRQLTFFNWEGGDGVNYFDRIVIGRVLRTATSIILNFYESPDYMSETPYADRTINYAYKLFTDPENGSWY